MTTALDRFLRYILIETTSKPDVEQVPSTDCQFDLARLLVEELKRLGLKDASVDEHCYVTATLKGNVDQDVPVIGWIAHMDTSPDVSGKNVKPQIIESYQGGDIVLSNGTVISEDEALNSCRGHRIVTTDGTTLLGADNKAGVAAIMTAVEKILLENKPHGTIRICFTPDEEVGNGTAYFDIKQFGAYCAYTVDGELPGELNDETFTARLVTVTVFGREIHPGTAKNVMVNALRVVSEIIARLPKDLSPENTEGKEPFIHPFSIEGSVGQATFKALLRGFCDDDLERLWVRFRDAIGQTQSLFPKAKIDASSREQYRNMKEKLDACPIVMQKLEEAARRSGVEPCWKSIRGGTDGSRLTEMGLPTPNVYTGGHHFHSPMEWLSVNHLERTVETLVNLAELWTEQ